MNNKINILIKEYNFLVEEVKSNKILIKSINKDLTSIYAEKKYILDNNLIIELDRINDDILNNKNNLNELNEEQIKLYEDINLVKKKITEFICTN